MVGFLLAIWLGSLISGWNLFYPWLVVPVVIFAIIVWRRQVRAVSVLKYNGLPSGDYRKQMFGPNLMVIGWNGLLNSVIFFVGALAGLLFRAAI